MKLTRHNGRAGKNGAYNPKHNDRRFDVANSEHIDMERTRQNIYWDCYTGLSSSQTRERGGENDYSLKAQSNGVDFVPLNPKIYLRSHQEMNLLTK